jgi:4-hydroxy-tetrahydrodipicolinate synthase
MSASAMTRGVGPHGTLGRSAFVVSITPFDGNGELDEPALRAHFARMRDAGIGVYVGGGGSGEGYTLTTAEHERVLTIAADALAGTAPVRAMGVEPRTATQMIEYVQLAAETGVDACQIYSLDPGHGHRPTTAEVEAYFLAVVEAAAYPMVLSTHLSVGYRVAPSFLRTLVDDHDHVVGVNCTHPDLGYLDDVIDAVGHRAAVHVGGPRDALTALAFGAQGFLSSEANLAPRLCARVIDATDAGRFDDAADAYATLARLSRVLYQHGGIRVTKPVLQRLGLPGGTVRAPQFAAQQDAVDAVLRAIDSLDIAAVEGW